MILFLYRMYRTKRLLLQKLTKQCCSKRNAGHPVACISIRSCPDNASVKVSSVPEDALPISQVKGFKDYPLLGTMPAIFLHDKFRTDRIHKFWRAAFDEYGPIVRVRYPWSFPIVLIYRPEDIERTYKLTQDNPIRYGFSSLRHVRRNAKDNFFEGKLGLLPENNEEWKRVRTKVQAPTLRIQNLFQYLPIIDEVSLDFIDRIQEFQDEKGEMPDNFLEEIYKWAIESVSLMTMNKRLGCLKKDAPKDSLACQLLDQITTSFICMKETEVNIKFWKYFPTPAIRRFQRACDNTLSLVNKVIEEGSNELSERTSHMAFLDVLRQSPGLSEKDVITFVLDMYGGGVDTTSHSVSFTLYLLSKHPEIQSKLQAEVDEVLGDGREPFNQSHYKKFFYLKNVIKESLRLFPVVVGTPRVLERDAVLSGYKVPKGYGVYCVNMVTSQHEDVFPRAKEFLPDRWRRNQPLGPIHPFASIPFAQGPRMCIGRRIAENEIYVLISRIMHRFNVGYEHDDIELETRLVGLPSKPLRFQFTLRNKWPIYNK